MTIFEYFKRRYEIWLLKKEIKNLALRSQVIQKTDFSFIKNRFNKKL